MEKVMVLRNLYTNNSDNLALHLDRHYKSVPCQDIPSVSSSHRDDLPKHGITVNAHDERFPLPSPYDLLTVLLPRSEDYAHRTQWYMSNGFLYGPTNGCHRQASESILL